MKPRGCVKKIYSESQAAKEADELRREHPEYGWFHGFCRTCGGFHLYRMKKEAA